MRECQTCYKMKDESEFYCQKPHYCKRCRCEMQKLHMSVKRYRIYLKEIVSLKKACGGIIARYVAHKKKDEFYWSIENKGTGFIEMGNEKLAFLETLKKQISKI